PKHRVVTTLAEACGRFYANLCAIPGHRVPRPCLELSGVSLQNRPTPRPRWAAATPTPAQAPTACPQCAFRSSTVYLQRLNTVHMGSIITQCPQCLQDPHSVCGVCTVCVPDGILWSRGVPYGAVLTASHGQPLPHLAGGLVLQADAVFLASLVRGSLASRYDGPVQVAALRARACPSSPGRTAARSPGRSGLAVAHAGAWCLPSPQIWQSLKGSGCGPFQEQAACLSIMCTRRTSPMAMGVPLIFPATSPGKGGSRRPRCIAIWTESLTGAAKMI